MVEEDEDVEKLMEASVPQGGFWGEEPRAKGEWKAGRKSARAGRGLEEGGGTAAWGWGLQVGVSWREGACPGGGAGPANGEWAVARCCGGLGGRWLRKRRWTLS